MKQDTKLEAMKNLSSQLNGLNIKHESLPKKKESLPSLIKSESAPLQIRPKTEQYVPSTQAKPLVKIFA